MKHDDGAFNDGFKPKPLLPWRLIGLLVICLLALAAKLADGAPNLPIVCPASVDATAPGKLVVNACGGSAQTGQVYRTPQLTDAVRVSPTQQDWASPDYAFKLWGQVTIGELYQVCGNDVPEGTPVPGNAACMSWPFIPKTAVSACRVDSACLSWTTVTTNTDGSPVAGPITYKVTRVGGSFNTTTATSLVSTPKTKGNQCFFVTAIDTNGKESDPTPTICKVLKVAAPSNGKIEAPSNGAITPKP